MNLLGLLKKLRNVFRCAQELRAQKSFCQVSLSLRWLIRPVIEVLLHQLQKLLIGINGVLKCWIDVVSVAALNEVNWQSQLDGMPDVGATTGCDEPLVAI